MYILDSIISDFRLPFACYRYRNIIWSENESMIFTIYPTCPRSNIIRCLFTQKHSIEKPSRGSFLILLASSFFVAVVDAVTVVVVMIHCSFSSSLFYAFWVEWLFLFLPTTTLIDNNFFYSPFFPIFILSNFFSWLVRSMNVFGQTYEVFYSSQCYLKSIQFSCACLCFFFARIAWYNKKTTYIFDTFPRNSFAIISIFACKF